MIRAAAVISLVLLLILVLYVPAVHPPERFLEQMRSEHQVAVEFWGAEPAYRMLDRAIRLQSNAAEASPLPALRDMPKSHGTNQAVASEMRSVNQRLFNNAQKPHAAKREQLGLCGRRQRFKPCLSRRQSCPADFLRDGFGHSRGGGHNGQGKQKRFQLAHSGVVCRNIGRLRSKCQRRAGHVPETL